MKFEDSRHDSFLSSVQAALEEDLARGLPPADSPAGLPAGLPQVRALLAERPAPAGTRIDLTAPDGAVLLSSGGDRGATGDGVVSRSIPIPGSGSPAAVSLRVVQDGAARDEALRGALQGLRGRLALLVGLVIAEVGALAVTVPALFREAGRSSLRALALIAAAAGVFSAGAVPPFAELLDAEAMHGLVSDGAVILLVSLLAVFELLLLLGARSSGARADAADSPGPGSGLGGIRIALFLFMLAEELSRSFLPLYARDLRTPFPGLSESLVMGLPIGLFMLLVAVFTPFAGAWADRFGSRRTLLVGTLPAVAGFLGTALAQSLVELLLWRSACALGYAVMFIGAQGFIARHTRREERTRGMAQFVAAVVVAGLCGAPIGGILADFAGPRATFAVSAALALAAALAAAALLPAEPGERARRRAVRLRDYADLLANPRFAALLAFSSVPTKLMLTGYLFYLVPVSLHGLGETPSSIGRILMIYGLTIVVLGPWVSRAADRSGRHALFAGLGGLVGGAGTLVVLQAPGLPGVLAGVAALGVAHALNNATQLALVPEVCRADCARIGSTSVFAIYRLLERGGSVLGPLLAAALADRFGHQAALGGFGFLGAASALAFCAVFVLAPPLAADAPDGDALPSDAVANATGGGAP